MALEYNLVEEIRWTDATVFDAITKGTWAFWFRARAGITTLTAIFHRHDNANSVGWRAATSFSNALDLKFELEAGSDGFVRTNNQPFVIDTFVHILVAYDGTQPSGSRARIWVNKVEDLTVTQAMIPAALGSPVGKSLGIGLQPLTMNAAKMRIAETYAWTGVAITSAKQIERIFNGCANTVQRGSLQFDAGLLVNPPVDRSQNAFPPTVSGTIPVVPHPAAVQNRATCIKDALRLRGRPPLKRTPRGIGLGI